MRSSHSRSHDRNQLSLFPEVEQIELDMEETKDESQSKTPETPGEDRESGV